MDNSDTTLIFGMGELSDGSPTTLRFAERAGKPTQVVALDAAELAGEIDRSRWRTGANA